MAPEVSKQKQAGPLNISGLAFAAIIAALYAALTALFAPISFWAVQFRVSEALSLMPMLSPHAVPGLFVGCLISNLVLGAPWQDVVFGSLATLLAALATRQLRRMPWLAALMPVVFNGLIVGAMLSSLYRLPLLATAGTVALGEAAVCYMLALPLTHLLEQRLGPRLLKP